MEEKNQIIEEIISNEEFLKNAVLICSYQNDFIKAAISGPITKALEGVREMAEGETKLKITFNADGFEVDKGKLDWKFSYYITNGKETVRLSYIFDNWGLKNLYYGIQKDGTSHGIAVTPIFNNVDENWPWGWEWVSDKYNSWNGESLYDIIEGFSDKTYKSSAFCMNILESIIKASVLLNE